MFLVLNLISKKSSAIPWLYDIERLPVRIRPKYESRKVIKNPKMAYSVDCRSILGFGTLFEQKQAKL